MNERIRSNQMYMMQEKFDALYADSKNRSNFYHLYDTIVSRNNILLAYRNLRTNTGANTAGIDGKTIQYLNELSDDDLVTLVRFRLEHYSPQPVRRVEIPKRFGGTRPLGIPTIVDRLIQQCFLQILEPIAEAKFYKHSYGFRPCRSAIHALSRAVSLINRGKMYYCVDVDIKAFFDTLNHDRLMSQLWSFGIRDRKVLSIIRKMLNAEIVGRGRQTMGVPQGGILSPLLANIYLTELDLWVSSQWEAFPTNINIHVFHNTAGKRSGLKSGYLVRYADDFKIFCRSYDEARRFDFAVRDYVRTRLKLEVNDAKSGVTNLKRKHTDFLGFSVRVISKGNTKNGFVALTNMSDAARQAASDMLKTRLKYIQFHSFDTVGVVQYNAAVIGIKNYYQYATNIYSNLDEIGKSICRVMRNRLAGRGIWSEYCRQASDYRTRNPGIQPHTKVMVINGMALDIINGIKHRNPMNFQQDMTPYTRKGRAKMGASSIRLREDYLAYVADCHKIAITSVEYLNNRLSVYEHQKGVCAVLGISFHPKDMECHHIIAKKRNGMMGDNSFKNLVFVHKDVHKLIHATKQEVIQYYLNLLQLTDKQLKKVNKYRQKIGNDEI